MRRATEPRQGHGMVALAGRPADAHRDIGEGNWRAGAPDYLDPADVLIERPLTRRRIGW